jgi:hypothetical protein
MPMREVQPGESLGARRGDVVVCVSARAGHEPLRRCLESVLQHTPPDVTILVCEKASVGTENPELVRAALEDADWGGRMGYLPGAAGVMAGIEAADPADVVVVGGDCVVADGWLTGLRAAAYSEARIATATALSNAAEIVSVPERNHPTPAGSVGPSADQIAAAVRGDARPLRPDLPSYGSHCAYIRRSGLELAGSFDPGFSQRCVIRGMRHVLADDVFVLRDGDGDAGRERDSDSARPNATDGGVAALYPWYDAWRSEVAADEHLRLASALGRASVAIRGMSVTIDGRCLTAETSGTAVATLELVAGLDAHTDLRVRVVVPSEIGQHARDVLGTRPAIELLDAAAVAGQVEPTDVAHRPYQVGAAEDIQLLSRVGRRIVVTQLDTIAFRNPAYFEGYEQWLAYRRLAAATVSAVDQMVYISQAAADDARALGLAPAERTHVVPLAAEPALAEPAPEPVATGAVDRIGGRPFLLCLGTDFLHKNRLFAIRVLDALSGGHGFDGALVLAGPKVRFGSSASEEAGYVVSRPELAERVIDLGAISEAEKRWLYPRAAAVLYPSVSEGFGLIPFEAARAGTPCLFAWHTSLAEYLPERAASIVPWDVEATAARLAPALVPGSERDRLVSAVATAGAQLTAQGNAHRHVEVYECAVAEPSPPGATLARELAAAHSERNSLRAELNAIYDDPLERGLAGRYAVLPPELRRPVLAVATRPVLRATAMALYRAAGAVSRAVQRAR